MATTQMGQLMSLNLILMEAPLVKMTIINTSETLKSSKTEVMKN